MLLLRRVRCSRFLPYFLQPAYSPLSTRARVVDDFAEAIQEDRKRRQERKAAADPGSGSSEPVRIMTLSELRPYVRPLLMVLHPDRMAKAGKEEKEANSQSLRSFMEVYRVLEEGVKEGEVGDLVSASRLPRDLHFRFFVNVGSEFRPVSTTYSIPRAVYSEKSSALWLHVAVEVVESLRAAIVEIGGGGDGGGTVWSGGALVCGVDDGRRRGGDGERRDGRGGVEFGRRGRKRGEGGVDLLLRNVRVLNPIVQGKVWQFPEMRLDQESPIPPSVREAIASEVIRGDVKGAFIGQREVEAGKVGVAKAFVDHFDAMWGFHNIWQSISLVISPSFEVVPSTHTLSIQHNASPEEIALYCRDAVPKIITHYLNTKEATKESEHSNSWGGGVGRRGRMHPQHSEEYAWNQARERKSRRGGGGMEEEGEEEWAKSISSSPSDVFLREQLRRAAQKAPSTKASSTTSDANLPDWFIRSIMEEERMDGGGAGEGGEEEDEWNL